MQFFPKVFTVSGLTVATLIAPLSPAATATVQVAPPETNQASIHQTDHIQLAQFIDNRPRLTVLPLSHGDISSDYWWWYNYDQGEGAAQGIAELLVNEIVNEGSYALLDSSLFMNEDGTPVDNSTAIEIAQENDLDAVLMGTITRFDLKDTEQCVRVPFRGRVCNNRTTATVKLNVRLVHPLSQTVLATAQGEGDASANSFGLDLYSGRIPDINSEEQQAVDELLSEATEEAIEQLVPELAEAQDKF